MEQIFHTKIAKNAKAPVFKEDSLFRDLCDFRVRLVPVPMATVLA